MIKMKWKTILPLCSVLLATTLGACSTDSSNESKKEIKESISPEVSQEASDGAFSEASQENNQEAGQGNNQEASQENNQEANQGNNQEASQGNNQEASQENNQEASQEESIVSDEGENEETKALLAYQKILKAAPAIEGEHKELEDASFGYDQNQALFGEHYDLFALYDLNQDGIQELIVQSTVNFRWTPVSVYTYVDGAAALVKNPLNIDAHGTFEQDSTASGAYTIYICEENHIHSVWRGDTPMGEMEENYAYALDGTSMTAMDCSVGENEQTLFFYDIAKSNTTENVDAIIP